MIEALLLTGEECTLSADDALGADPIGPRVVTGLAKIGLATRHHAWSASRGLTPSQGQILAMLRAHPQRSMRVTQLAAAMAVTAPTASVAVAALEQKGLVQKARAGDDARARAISLTEEGEREAVRAANWSDFLLSAVDELTPQEQTAFFRALVKIIITLQQRGEIPVSRMCATCTHFRPNVSADPERAHHCAFVDAPLGDRSLRLDCPDHLPAPTEQARLGSLEVLASR
jgi:DNA-binding MarR family transcriptional regulator